MSIAKVKKRFAELEAYLGSDKEGIKRLRLLKDEVNNLRTDLAAANEAAQLAQTIKDAARERADVAEVALTEAQVENLKLRNQISSLMFDLSTVTRPEGSVEKCVSNKDESAVIKTVLKSLRKRSRPCPQAFKESSMLEDRTLFFDREEITPGWSHENLWALGASVAALTLMMGRVVIASKRKFRDVCATDRKGVVNNWIDWFGQYNISREQYEEDLEKRCKSVIRKRDMLGKRHNKEVQTGFGQLYRENPDAFDFEDDDEDDDDDDDCDSDE